MADELVRSQADALRICVCRPHRLITIKSMPCGGSAGTLLSSAAAELEPGFVVAGRFELACAELESVDNRADGEGLVRLVHVETLLLAVRDAEARAALSRARDRLLLRASRISNETDRTSFLSNVSDHARTLELAREMLGALYSRG